MYRHYSHCESDLSNGPHSVYFSKKINKVKNVMNTSLLLNVDLSILYRPSIYNDYREKKCMLEKKTKGFLIYCKKK